LTVASPIISNNPTHARTRQPQHVRDSGHVVLTRVDRIAYAGIAALVLL
jgi:hypothetical protein